MNLVASVSSCPISQAPVKKCIQYSISRIQIQSYGYSALKGATSSWRIIDSTYVDRLTPKAPCCQSKYTFRVM